MMNITQNTISEECNSLLWRLWKLMAGRLKATSCKIFCANAHILHVIILFKCSPVLITYHFKLVKVTLSLWPNSCEFTRRQFALVFITDRREVRSVSLSLLCNKMHSCFLLYLKNRWVDEMGAKVSNWKWKWSREKEGSSWLLL